MTVHRAAHGFDRSADAYERGRPDYPAEAVHTIARVFGITPSSTIVDLAAGTGKLTRLLVSTGAHIVAVEPIFGMREQLLQQVSGVDVRDGTADDMPLADRSVDVVTIAQAFHWFANDRALTEIHRVLHPGGGLALIWNRRDMTQPLQRAITELVEPYRGDAPSHRSGDWQQVFHGSRLFSPLQEWHFSHEQDVDADRLVDRVMSISFVATLPDSERTRLRGETLELAQGLPARFPLRYVTDIYCCRALNHQVR